MINIIRTFLYLLLLALSSCKEDEVLPKPNPKGVSLIIDASITASYKPSCQIGFDSDTIVSKINFIPKDSSVVVNSIKIKTVNSSSFPDSFVITKGFTWLDYKIVSYPPVLVKGVSMIIEPNGTVSCVLKEKVINSFSSTKYTDTISTRFELGQFEDIVNLKSYKAIESTKKLNIHLPSVNNQGNNILKFVYEDSIGIDSGAVKGEITLTRSTPDSAINTMVFYWNYPKIGTFQRQDLVFSQNGDVSRTGLGDASWGDVKLISKNGNDYKFKVWRPLDPGRNYYLTLVIEAWHGCSGNPSLLFKREYKFKTP